MSTPDFGSSICMLFAIITIIIASSSFIVKLKFFLQIYSTIDSDKKNDFFCF